MLFESNVLLHFFQVPWYVPCGGVCYGDGNLVFVANDWHTALLPVYLKAYYRDNGIMKFTRSILVIHNIAHQVSHISLVQFFQFIHNSFHCQWSSKHFNQHLSGGRWNLDEVHSLLLYGNLSRCSNLWSWFSGWWLFIYLLYTHIYIWVLKTSLYWE